MPRTHRSDGRPQAALDGRWRLRSPRRAVHVSDVGSDSATCRGGPWNAPPSEAVVLPLRGASQERTSAFLVAGVSPCCAFDDAYRGFLDLVAGQVAAAHRQRAGLRGGATTRRGAGRARSRQDRVLLERQPRVPHAADPDARPGEDALARGDHAPRSASGSSSSIATRCGC